LATIRSLTYKKSFEPTLGFASRRLNSTVGLPIKSASGASKPAQIDIMGTQAKARMHTSELQFDAPAAMSPLRAGRWFYVGVTLFVIFLNIISFGPSIINPATRTVPLPLTFIDLAHAVVSVAWLLVFLAQVMLIATGRPSIHRRLGIAGVLLSIAFIVVTWLTLVEGAQRGFDLSGDLVPRGTTLDPATLLAPANTLVPTGVLIGAAVWYRRRPAVHKRLMMLAILTSTGAPIAHLVGHWPALRPYPVINPISGLLLLSLLAIRDRVSERRIHPVSLWGAIGVFVWLTVFFTVIVPMSAWRDFAAWSVQ
jgi:hypothetical protein